MQTHNLLPASCCSAFFLAIFAGVLNAASPADVAPVSVLYQTPVAAPLPGLPSPSAVGAAPASSADISYEQALLRQYTNAQNGVSFHKEMFLLPLTYNDKYNGDESETIYQLSFKVRVISDLYFAYTQRSFWQAYNTQNSSPFRETNYNPEVFFRFAPGNSLSSKLGFDAGIEHNSNGKTVPDSRSWNRVFGAVFYPRQSDVFYFKAWYRLPESAKAAPGDSIGDDNPDITDYWGHTQWEYSRCLDGNACHQLWDIKLRGNWSTGKGALETHLSFPTGSTQVSWYVMLFSGYGESLIDYNHAENRIGLGVTIQPR